MTEGNDQDRTRRLWTFTDREFYEVEMKVFDKMKREGNDRCATAACRDLGVDPYDFRDRWGSLLRKHSPEEILENVIKIRPYIGQPVREIAVNLGIGEASVRSFIRKLVQTAHSRHVRTKDNLAHRLLATSGCSLQDAKDRIPSRLKLKREVITRENQPADTDSLYTDSDSSAESEESTSKRPKVCAEPTKPPQSSGREGWYEQLIKLCAGVETLTHEVKGEVMQAEKQLKVLCELTYGERDIAKACRTAAVEETAFRALWYPLLKLIPAKSLEATLFATVSLTRLGYGVPEIAAGLLVTPNYVHTLLTNLNLELGPCDNHCYDFTLALAAKVTPSEAASVQLCSTELARLMHRRVALHGKVRAELREKLRDEALVGSVMWLYERGVPVGVIATALGVNAEDLRKAGAEESG